jgi:hypothetical protein
MSTVDFNFGDLIDEAVENAGLDPAAITHRHLISINRSLQLLFIDLEADGPTVEYRLETRVWTVGNLVGGVVLDPDVIDVTMASILFSPDGTTPKPYPLGRTTREDYMNLSFPSLSTQLSVPSVYWLTKSIRTTGNTEQLPIGVTIPPAATGSPVLVIWPQNGLTGTVQVTATVLRQHTMPVAFGDALDTRRSMLPTICAGLSARIANKYNPAEWERLNGIYEAMKQRRVADEDHHPVIVAWRGPGWSRGRRH